MRRCYNILISSASKKIGLIKAFRRASDYLGCDCKIVSIDATPGVPAFGFSDAAYVVPPTYRSDFQPMLDEIIASENINVIIPTRDEELELFSRMRKKHSDICIPVSPVRAIRVCRDKHIFAIFCAICGLETPKIIQNYAFYEGDMFLRETFGSGSRKSRKITATEIPSVVVGKYHMPLFTEYVGDCMEYTVDVFCDWNSNPVCIVPRERNVVVNGESKVTTTRNIPEIIDECKKLVAELRPVGHINIQCFWKPGSRPRFIEANLRYGGASKACFEAGHLTPVYVLQMAAGFKKTIPMREGFVQDLVVKNP